MTAEASVPTWDELEPKVSALLDKVELASGHHSDGKQACAMDLLVMAVEGEWRDTMSCVHPNLSRHVHRMNDSKYADAGLRRRIVELCGPLLIGTAEWDPVRCSLAIARGGMTPEGFAAALAEELNLGSADLGYADLRSADLRYADLRYADLRSADLRYADLRYADLRYADLRSADLRSADLGSADLRYADLRSADLRSANLRSADLRYADLRSANLRSADLRSANLRSAVGLGAARNLELAFWNDETVWPDGFTPPSQDGAA